MCRGLPFFAFFLATLSFAPCLSASSSPKYPEYVLGGTELRTLPRSADGRDYLLYVALPYSYSTEPHKKYPVVYVTDGYWAFARMVGLYSSLWYDKVVPEFIAVGLGYAGENLDYNTLRQWELSPVSMSLFHASGHAKEFLDAIEHEIIPFVEHEYRADPRQRVLTGGSLGGLFTLYSMLTKPELFNGYISMSPSVGLGSDWIFKREAEFFSSHQPPKGRLFMTVGGYESPGYIDNVKRFNDRLLERKYPDLSYTFRIIDGERHGASNSEATNRGLRYVFEPIAPESGPMR
jgi:predicted alpha/beta superfamily hydrolase